MRHYRVTPAAVHSQDFGTTYPEALVAAFACRYRPRSSRSGKLRYPMLNMEIQHGDLAVFRQGKKRLALLVWNELLEAQRL